MITMQQIGQNLQNIRESLKVETKKGHWKKMNQATFYDKYLKNIPGIPPQPTAGAAAKYMSKIESGERQLPVNAYAVYSDLGGVSLDWILSGHEYQPTAQAMSYADALRALVVLEASSALSIADDAQSVQVNNYALRELLAAYRGAKDDAVALGSASRIEAWLGYVVDRTEGKKLERKTAAEIQAFHEWQLQSYAQQIQAGEKSSFALLLDSIGAVSK